MGLDMYLYAGKTLTTEDPLHDKVMGVLTDENKASLDSRDEERYAYVAGWTWRNDPAYRPLVDLLDLEPHEGSPHIGITKDPASGALLIEAVLYYWRKANAIHAWFVENAQGGTDDCDTYVVGPETLAGLVDRLERVAVDHDLAEDLLPTRSGFFFGDTDYDDWYFEEVTETARNLKMRMQAVAGKGFTFRYRSSW